LDIFLSFNPYFMNMKGTGSAKAAMPPRIDIAGPTPRWLNIGLAASGRPPAIKLRKNVLAETAEAAYSEYVSTRKLMHCWKMMLKPAPMKAAAMTHDGHGMDGSAVQPNQNRPIVNRKPPILIGSNLASGTCGEINVSMLLSKRFGLA
jgi:hypothetical protein